MRDVVFFLLLVCAVTARSQQSVDAVLAGYQTDPDLKHAAYSLYVAEAQSGKVIKEYHADLSLVPASTLKIVTTSAALGILGKNYTYKTNLYTTRRIDSVTGILDGDIIIRGSGDPTLNSAYFYKEDADAIQVWATKMKRAGLRQLNGAVLTDASCFDASIPSTWIWGDIGNYFGAGANGLSYSDNKFILTFHSYEPGKKASLLSIKTRMGQQLYHDTVTDSVFSGGSDDNAYIFGGPGDTHKTVRGTIPPNQAAYEVEGAMADPAAELRDHLAELLSENGVVLKQPAKGPGGKYESFSYPSYNLAYTHTSPPLEKIVYFTNTKSDNHYAESLLKTVGGYKSGRQGTTDNGVDAVVGYWKGRGVDVSGLLMVDGSGLSRANAITTRIQGTILGKIYRDSLMYPAFNASLPVAGKNGSMAGLCKGTFAENNLRAKTGYITRARGYCGYVKTKAGKELVFAVLFNNYSCSPKEMKLKIEKLLVALTGL